MNRPRIVFHKNKQFSNTLYMLGAFIVSLNFGTAFQIVGVNISHFVAVAFALVFIWEEDYLVFNTKQDKRVILFFLFWLLYAFLQVIEVRNLEYYLTFIEILLLNVVIVISILFEVSNQLEFIFLIKAATFSVWLNILAAAWEYFTGNIIVNQTYLFADRHYIAGFIGNFNDFCTFMFFGIILFAIQLFFAKSIFEKAYCLAGIIAAIVIILYDGSRGGIYALICSAVLFPMFLILDSKLIPSRRTKVLIAIGGIAAVIAIMVIVKKKGINGALYLLDNSGGGDIQSDIGRFRMIKEALVATVDTIGFGVGAGQSIVVCGGINVHNFFVEILCEYGLVVFLFVVYFAFIIPLRRNSNLPCFLNAVTQTFACGFLIASVTSSSINKMRMLWIVLTLLYILKQEKQIVFDESKNKWIR